MNEDKQLYYPERVHSPDGYEEYDDQNISDPGKEENFQNQEQAIKII